jgi:hypothetical protein
VRLQRQKIGSVMKYSIMFIPFFFIALSCNPFAPGLDDASGETTSLLSDQKNPDGVFQNLKYAYTFRDTTIYGELLDGNFTFSSYDYDENIPITWQREEEMQTTQRLFQNVQRLDLVWNNIIDSTSTDLYTTQASIRRGFNLTVTFNPSYIERVDGYTYLQLGRPSAQDPWRIVLWYDESNH